MIPRIRIQLRMYSVFIAEIVAILILATNSVLAGEVRIAAASNFSAPLIELTELFQQSTGHSAKVSYASSGKLYAQILHGAPFDVFLSADEEKPNKLIAKGLSLASSLKTYAVGSLVLWSRSAPDAEPLARLKSGDFNRLSLANPRFAPYGIAAQDVLQHYGLLSSTRPKWILGENIAQTFQFVSTGHAQLGFVAASQLQFIDTEVCCLWSVPEALHRPIVQNGIILNRGIDNEAANAFFDILSTEAARKIIEKHGYKLPRTESATDTKEPQS